MSLVQRWVVVTGASGGIGSALARALWAEGARLVLLGRSESRLRGLSDELMRTGVARHGEVVTIAADLCTGAGRETVRARIADLPGPVHALVLAAGVNHFAMHHDTSADDITRMMATNALSPMLLVPMLLPYLDPNGGRILSVGSTFGGIGYPGFAAYCASKFALRGFTQALRRELSGSGIQVAHLAPRATRTDLNSAAVCAMNQELGNAMDPPELVAKLALDMLQARRMRDRNMGWPERLFLRINAWFPSVVDGALAKQLPIIARYARKSPAPAEAQRKSAVLKAT